MILVLSTFKKLNNEVKLFFYNLHNHLSKNLHLVFSSPDLKVHQFASRYNFCSGVVKDDMSYAEGWNHALKEAKSLGYFRTGVHVCFLGEGDKILNMPDEIKLPQDKIVCGITIRNPDGKKPSIKKSNVNKRTLWLGVGGWTPSYLVPLEQLNDFKFDPVFGFAADIELFMYLQKIKELPLVKCRNWIIGMNDGGMSDGKNLDRYQDVVRRYYPIHLVKLGYVLRKVRRFLR